MVLATVISPHSKRNYAKLNNLDLELYLPHVLERIADHRKRPAWTKQDAYDELGFVIVSTSWRVDELSRAE